MLPVLVLLLTVGVGTVGAVAAQLRCIDAAREAARATARGEPIDVVRELAGQAAPPGATVSIAAGSERIEVVVTAEVAIGGGLLPPVQVAGTAVAVPEPTSTIALGPRAAPGARAP